MSDFDKALAEHTEKAIEWEKRFGAERREPDEKNDLIQDLEEQLAKAKAEIARLTNNQIKASDIILRNGDQICSMSTRLAIANNEIARLRTPAAIWRAYHALGNKVLGPRENGRRKTKDGETVLVVCCTPSLDEDVNTVSVWANGDRLDVFKGTEDEGWKLAESWASERGYTLIGGES